MEFPIMTPDLCAQHARVLFKKDTGYSNKTDKELDKEIGESLIGTTYHVASELWNLINPAEIEAMANAHINHLFWALLFLKCYCIEPILTRVVGGVDATTFRTWVWLFLEQIQLLKIRVVVFDNRFRQWDGVSICLISVDGVDCAIQEPYPFDEGIFSKKLNGPGFKYEIGVCIMTGAIVWVNGPFKAGRHDVKIFLEDGLKFALSDDEAVEVDAGYQGDDALKNPNVAQTRADRREKSVVRSRHEVINSWFKKFEVLNAIFRHHGDTKRSLEEKHRICFDAVAVITQLRFEFHGGPFDVEYAARYD